MKPFCIGRLVKPFGLKGLLKAIFYIDELDDLRKISAFYVRDLKSSTGYREIRFSYIKEVEKGYIVSIEGCSSRSEADLYRNVEILVDEDKLPPPGDDFYYIKDLIGLQVIFEEDFFGKVSNFLEVGSDLILIIRMKDGKELAVPYRGRYIKSISLPKGEILLENLRELM